MLGQGSFGITYLAKHTGLGKNVAIKGFFMKDLNSRTEDGSITGMSDSSLSYNYCQKFKKEAINLSNLDHSNIVRVTDSFAENGTFYYVMDYIEGQNLNDYIKTHYINEGEAVNIINCVADALIYMHEIHHMLHLDLKPSNVMRRSSDSHIFLIDFGLSKHFDKNGVPDTSTTIGLGTAGYAPIEQANQAKNGEFRPTIDVYALGATLYKLLTGETPPDASMLVSDNTLIEKNLAAKGISKNLVGVVVASMKPSVYERIQTARAFNDSLNDKIKDEETLVAVAHLPKHAHTVGKPNQQFDGDTNNGSKIIDEGIRYLLIVVCIVGVIVVVALTGGVGQCSANKTEATVNDSDSIEAPISEDAVLDSIIECQMIINGNACTYTGSATTDSNGNYVAEGNGRADFDNGNFYSGPFVNGEMQGSDAYYVYSNGDTFKGSFVSNHFSEGAYTVKESGEYFSGTFDSQGQPKSGVWYDKNGRVLEQI